VVDAALLEQLGAVIGGGQQRLERFGAEKLCRMRVEGDGDGGDACGAGLADGLGRERLVASVDAVEIADGDDALAAGGRSGVSQGVAENSHGMNV
jgi:hypothetical protein